MNKSTFKKQFPDVCVQKVTFIMIASRQAVEDYVIHLTSGLNTGLLGYTYSGKKLEVFTSERFKTKLDNMTKGTQLLDENTGLTGTITSDKPFICSCEMCIRIDFGSGPDVFACTYFKN